jgi:hypothetical protein
MNSRKLHREGTMGRQRLLVCGVIVLFVGFGIVLTALGIGYSRIPAVKDQISAAENITIVFVSPATGSRYPADAAVPVTALARGANAIKAMEFWVDGKLVESKPPALGGDAKFVYQSWHWMPVITGEHLLVVRAWDTVGNIGISNILRLTADEPAGFSSLHTVTDMDTWDSLVQSCDTSGEDIAAQNPDLDPAATLPVGAQISIPCGTMLPPMLGLEPETTAPLGDIPASSSVSAPNKLGLWISDKISSASDIPAAPGLTAGLNNCTVQLSIQDNSKNEAGFEVWRSGLNGFDLIATLGAKNGGSFLYEDTIQQGGQVQYTVSAFNTNGTTASNLAPVNIPNGTCGPAANPNVGFADGILTLPPDVNLAYFYASLDKSHWTRLPPGDDFFEPTHGQVDLREQLNPLLAAYPNVRSADLELWGWSGEELTDLGSLTVTFDSTTLSFCNLDTADSCTGDMGSNHWVTQGDVYTDALNSSRTFRYSANNPGIPYLLVQVSSKPFTEEFQLDYPYLVDAFAVQTEQNTSSISGKFTLNFSYYQQVDAAPEPLPFIDGLFFDLEDPAASPSPFDLDLIQTMKTNAGGYHFQDGLLDPTYYVRVIPWDYSKPVGKVSNEVVLTYKAHQEPPPYNFISASTPIYDLEIIDFSPEQSVVPALFGCVVISKIDEQALRASYLKSFSGMIPFPISESSANETINEMVNFFQNVMSSGQPVCPKKAPVDDDTALDDLGTALTTVWNEIVQAFNAIKNTIVDIVVQALNGLFGPDFCESKCRSNLLTTLNWAITYFTGIPPNLPTTDELIEDGLNYVVSVAVSEAGIDCNAKCVADIRSDLKSVSDALSETASQPGCFSGANNNTKFGKLPLCLPDGLTVKPIPGGAYIPAIVTLKATSRGPGIQFLPNDNYALVMTSSVRNDTSVGKKIWFDGTQYVLPYMTPVSDRVYFEFTIPEPIEGELFAPVSMPLPDTLDKGSELIIPVTLKKSQAVPGGEKYVIPELLAQAQSVAQAKNYTSNAKIMEALLWEVQRISMAYLNQTGYSIKLNAVLLCYDKVAQKKTPCANPATLDLSAAELQARAEKLQEAQP